MLKFILNLENLFYRLRDFIWSYPDLIFGSNSIRRKFFYYYKLSLPYSHFVLSIGIFTLIFFTVYFNIFQNITRASFNTLVEGVVMGIDSTGKSQRLTKVDPLSPTNIQLEKDLVELIYEPLIKYEFLKNSDGSFTEGVREILAQSVVEIRKGADYQFNLRKNVQWHDGVFFNANDVIRTFELISKLDFENAYITAVKQLRWEKIDDYSVRVCTKTTADSVTCNNTKDNPIFSNFLELISVKIIPAHKTQDVGDSTLNFTNSELLRSPVGTGRYKFKYGDDRNVVLSRNDEYYNLNLIPQIGEIRFKYYRTYDEVVSAMQNSEIHSLASTSSQSKTKMLEYGNVITSLSPVLDNQYWAMYFNLRKDQDGKSIGPVFFQDKKVRQAISMAVDRNEVIEDALYGIGEEASGPISLKSFFFNSNAVWKSFNLKQAEELLNSTEWKYREGNKYRTNANGDLMEFSLYFVNSFDRTNVAKVIQKNLEDIGIKVIINRREQKGQDPSENAPEGWSLEELNNQLVSTRLFDALLYGMNTFIDPDRFELFHSTQSVYPKLNLSSYVGTEETVKPRENRQEGESSLVRLPRVDRILELTRTYDPVEAKDARKENYDKFQELLADDSPVVFLYNPRFIYYYNVRVENLDLENVVSLEDRFRNIEKWEID